MMGVFLIVLTIFTGIKAYNEFKSGKYIGLEPGAKNTITVSSKGDVFAVPDVAKFFVSVIKEGKEAVEAQNKAAEAINGIIKFLKESGVEKKDIKTTVFSVYPRYDYIKDEGRVFRGYDARQTLEVKVRKISSAGEILAGAARLGADNVGGISFVLDDEEGAKREARKKAIEKAKEKAKYLAKDLDVDLARIVGYSESGGRPPIFRAFGGDTALSEGAEAPELPAGENKISVEVNLTYEIK